MSNELENAKAHAADLLEDIKHYVNFIDIDREMGAEYAEDAEDMELEIEKLRACRRALRDAIIRHQQDVTGDRIGHIATMLNDRICEARRDAQDRRDAQRG